MKVAIIGSGPAAAGVLIGLQENAPDAKVTIFDIGKVPDVNPVHTRAPKDWSEDEYDKLHSQIKSQFGFAFPPPKTFFGQGLRKHQAGENAKPFISEFYGGLSRHWSASVFPFVEKDFGGWPIEPAELSPYYQQISDHIGISGRHDELNSYFGEDYVNRPPIDIPSPIQKLNDHINGHTEQEGNYKIISGLNRLAVETRSENPNSCVYCGECMYGCFRSSIYDATKTVEQAKASGQVGQIVNERVLRVASSNGGISFTTENGEYSGFDKLYLGAGCFGTSEILMRSLGLNDEITVKDNNSYVFPIFYVGGDSANGNHSEYVSITNTILGVVPNDGNGHYAHVHISPFADYYWRYYFPVGYWQYLKFFASKFKARMILAKMYFPTEISKSYSLTLNENDGFRVEKKSYGPSDETARDVLKHLRRVISGKGFILPPVKLVRMSTSSHYVGAFAYDGDGVPVKRNGEVMPNVYIADSSVFPESPAANAHLHDNGKRRTNSTGVAFMTGKKVVLTGAHSYLGQKLLTYLSEKGGYEIAAFITPWADETGLVTGESIRYFKVDLTKELPDDAAMAVSEADRVLHFAWIRGKGRSEVGEQNLAMIANLQKHLSRPEALVFISSVAASPETLSRYGRTKYTIANKLREDGAIILVTGLIVDPEPKGPYKLLVDVVRKAPFRVRFTKNSVKVYPIRTDDFLNAISVVLDTEVPSGSYRVYPVNPEDINDFLMLIENKYDRSGIKVPVSYGLSMGALRAGHKVSVLPPTLGEKLMTFLYKDDKYLSTHATLPGTESIDRPLSEMI